MTGLLIVRPYDVLSANISATNIALETAWNSGTAYAIGSVVRYNDRLWRAILASTNSTPSDTNTNWLDIGPINRLAAFDIQRGSDKYRVVETKTTSAGNIEYTLTGLSRVTSIAFFGLDAARIEITASSGYSVAYDLKRATPILGSYFNWFFGRIVREKQYIVRQINIPASNSITIVISNNGAATSVASIVLGKGEVIGHLSEGPTRSSKSRSVVKFDGTTTTLIQRYPVPYVNFNLMLYNNEAAALWGVLDELDAIAAVFGPSEGEHPELFAYGVLQNPQTVKLPNGISQVSLEVVAL